MQKALIDKHISSARFIYNLALETKTFAYSKNRVTLSRFDLQKQMVDLKKECLWLRDVNSQSLQVSLLNLDTAYQRFFKGQGFPKYKKKSNTGSFCVPQNVTLKNDLLVIPKFKNGIKAAIHRPIEGVIKSATVSVTKTNKYFVSILVDSRQEIPIKKQVTSDSTIGIDLGIKSFLVSSDGMVILNPKFLLKAQNKLKYTHRKHSKYKGKRTRKRLALLYEKVVNKRKDFLHKTSINIIRENQTVAIEDLAVSNMVKNHSLAQSINDAGWSFFISLLEYKADWLGKNIVRIGRFAPSSKTCLCGAVNKELTLSDRVWTCKVCGTTHDRDLLAAKNIKTFALRSILPGTGRKNQGELSTIVEVKTLEADPSPFGMDR